MHKLSILLFTLASLSLHCESKVFSRCELVRELRRQGFAESQLKDWVCLIEKESKSNTAAVSGVSSNGARHWGLYQLSDKYWCSTTNTAGKECNVRCRDLTTDDITKASTCAKLVYRRQGFNAWTKWVRECKGQRLPDISQC